MSDLQGLVDSAADAASDELIAMYENAPKVETIPLLGVDGHYVGYAIMVNGKMTAIWKEDTE